MNDLSLSSVWGSFEEFVSHWGGFSFDKESNVVCNDDYMSNNTPRSHNYKFSNLLASLATMSLSCQSDHPMLYLHLNDVIAKGTNLNSLFLESCCNISVVTEDDIVSSLDQSLDRDEMRRFYIPFGDMVYKVMFSSLCEVSNYIKNDPDLSKEQG